MQIHPAIVESVSVRTAETACIGRIQQAKIETTALDTTPTTAWRPTTYIAALEKSIPFSSSIILWLLVRETVVYKRIVA